MLSTNKNLGNSKSALVSLVYDFLDDVATFDSGEYEIVADAHYTVTYKVKAGSAKEAEDAEFYFDECEADEPNFHEVRSVTKVNAEARSVVNPAAVENFIATLLSVVVENKEEVA
jgi:hypothetical protein